MVDYTLYYWPLPFRGEFVRAVLAHVGVRWNEADIDTIVEEKSAEPARQLIPHMGPPLLIDHRAKVTISQLPAVLAYLGVRHALMPSDPVAMALTHKVIGDANDVLYEMTRHNGDQMWTEAAWSAYQPRLHRWLAIFEEMGRRHSLRPESGYLLDTAEPGMADLVCAVLWGRMTGCLPQLRPLLDTHAPAVAGLCDRITAIPSQAVLAERSVAAFGTAWCGGDIEGSLRAVLGRQG
ncbi:MAG: glutathione S-transferase [Pseudomonadota bacterium]